MHEHVSDAGKHHYDTPNLGRRKGVSYKFTACISARKLDNKSPNAVSDCVQREVVIEIELEIQRRHNRAQQYEKQHFEQLCGNYLIAHRNKSAVRIVALGAVNAVPRVRHLAVTATRPKTAEPAESVRYGNAYRYKRKRVCQPRVHFARQHFYFGAGADYVHIKVPHSDETENSADKPAYERHASAEVETARRVCDVVVDRLKEHCGKNSEARTEDTYKNNRVARSFAELLFPHRELQKAETGYNTERHTYAVQIDALTEYMK